jgi:hypothetical protein
MSDEVQHLIEWYNMKYGSDVLWLIGPAKFCRISGKNLTRDKDGDYCCGPGRCWAEYTSPQESTP